MKSEIEAEYIQLKKEDTITAVQYQSIAELIFDTDPYIYPAMFGEGEPGKENAKRVLPVVFETNRDTMFIKDNLFIMKMDGIIVGLILWHKGELVWNPVVLNACAKGQQIELNEQNLKRVGKEYVSDRYLTEEDKKLHIINVCVLRHYRRRGLSSCMMKAFIQFHSNEDMELAVLADNKPATALYQKFGFEPIEETEGFSLENKKPRVLIMTRFGQ